MSTEDSNNGKSDGSIDYKDPETLRRLYWGEGMTFNELSDYFGVGNGTLQHYMNKFDIDTRDQTPFYAPYTVNNGYPRWNHKNDDGADAVAVHRLLAVLKYGFEKVKGNVVHHKNGVKWDNRMENIEVMSQSEHQSKHYRGENNHQAKLTRSDIVEIRDLLKKNITQSEIAEKYNTDQGTISRIKHGKYWSHVTTKDT